MEFRSWKVNLRTEVCSKTVDPQITMHWIKKVEIARTIDELMTSRSIVGRTDFPDYDILDAIIASALKKLLDKHVRFRRRVSAEEQRAQKDHRFLRGRQIAYMIYEHFRATGVVKLCKVCQILSIYAYRMKNFMISMYDGTELYYHQVEHLQKWSRKDYTSQNCRLLFCFFETMGNRVIQD